MRSGARGRSVFHSITFRIVFSSLSVFLLSWLTFFAVLDRFQRKYLMERIDADLETEVLVVTSRLAPDPSEAERTDLADELDRVARTRGISRYFIRLLGPGGEELAASDLGFWAGVREVEVPRVRLQQAPIVWETRGIEVGDTRFIYYRFPDGSVLQGGHVLTEMQAATRRARLFSATGMSIMLVVGGLLTWLLTLRASRGIRQVSRAAAAIREHGELARRVVEVTGARETDQLAVTFNKMLGRIETLVHNLHDFMDHIAHDIRTPVTRMRGIAEAALIDGEQDSELCGHILEECDVILSLVNTLLQITTTESGLYPWNMEPVDLAEMVREGCELFDPVLEDKQLTLTLDLPDRLVIETDGRVMQRVIANLVDNAVKYGRTGGKVAIRASRGTDEIQLSIADDGIGIAPADLPHIFNRFYREDRSRSRPGHGLGLAFCKAAIEGLGGAIRCESELGGGTRFTITLPVAEPSADQVDRGDGKGTEDE